MKESSHPVPVPRERRGWSGRRWSDRFGAPLVLVVEPHDDTRLLYTYLFETYTYAVHAAADALAAVEIARVRLPDVVVTELALPHIDGFEMLARLRENPETSRIPCVVVSSLLHSAEPDRARAAGAVAFLAKPVEVTSLVAEVDAAVSATPRRRLVERQLRRSLTTLREVAHRVKVDAQAQQRVRSLIDRLQVAVLAIDDVGHYVAVSPGASALTGYSREELLQMSIDETGLPLGSKPPESWRDSTIEQSPVAATFLGRNGARVNVHTAFCTILPGLHLAAFAALDQTGEEETQHKS